MLEDAHTQLSQNSIKNFVPFLFATRCRCTHNLDSLNCITNFLCVRVTGCMVTAYVDRDAGRLLMDVERVEGSKYSFKEL